MDALVPVDDNIDNDLLLWLGHCFDSLLGRSHDWPTRECVKLQNDRIHTAGIFDLCGTWFDLLCVVSRRTANSFYVDLVCRPLPALDQFWHSCTSYQISRTKRSSERSADEMMKMKRVLLILIGFALIVCGAFYGLFAPVRVSSNIDSYEGKLRPIIVENLNPERFDAREYDLDGLLHLAREGWSCLETSAIILLVSGLAILLLGLLDRVDPGQRIESRTRRGMERREAAPPKRTSSAPSKRSTFCGKNEMKIQLTLLLAYANIGFWIWMMSALTTQYGFPSEIEHVPMIGFAFSLWLALRVQRAENKSFKRKEIEE